MALDPRPLVCACLALVAARAQSPLYRFNFSAQAGAGAGAIAVSPETTFSPERGYGFEPGAKLTPEGGALASSEPFYFSARVPHEGNYRVRVVLGDDVAETVTTIKAELRRLMVERVSTAPGEAKSVEFIVNTRVPQITPAGAIAAGRVRLKAPRETTEEAWAWDDLITLEFNNRHPAVRSIEIAPAPALPTVFLIGDSTVCDQSREPYNSWGQMLPNFFRPDIAVANHAESGETYRDSIGRCRLDKILSVMKPGDYLLMQFGHNDQKQIAAKSGGPFTTYQAEMKRHIDGVRSRGGIPVVISPMERRAFKPDGSFRPSLAEYARAAREEAKALHVAFIDLNAQSIRFYEALGEGKAYLAFAGTGKTRDATHHDNYGSYELAQMVAQGIRDCGLPLAAHLKPDFKRFDPSHPDPVEAFVLPASPNFTNQRPLGD
jgi:lysophospholipase L1-like esterase